MKFTKSVTIIAFLTILSNTMCSQNSPTQIVEKFFETYQNKSISEAMDELYSTNQWMLRNIDAVTN